VEAMKWLILINKIRNVRQGCGFSHCLFKIFTDIVTDCSSIGNVHAPVIGKMSIPELWFEDDLTIG
jgi:hypothetical protein